MKNLALVGGMQIFNNAITVTRRRRIPVRHEVPEHTEWCETMRIPTDYDHTDWNPVLNSWQCQFCQRVYDLNTNQFITEDEYKEIHKHD